RLLEEDAVETLVECLLPLATVVTPNLAEARVLAEFKQQSVPKFNTAGTDSETDGPAVFGKQQTVAKAELTERIHALGASAVIVTGGHGDPVDHLFDGTGHVEISVPRYDVQATHGAGCTHSARVCAGLARGLSLEEAARAAAETASAAVALGLADLGAGEGPVDVFNLEDIRERDRDHAFDRG